MSSEFNPYREWLSIPANELPANYYRLLGLALFESDPNVIDSAAARQMSFIYSFQTGQYAQQSRQLLNELAAARNTLLDSRKKAEYDAKLRAEQKSGSNGGKGIVSSLGSYGEVQSVPPPSSGSFTPPQTWSNNTPPSSSSNVQLSSSNVQISAPVPERKTIVHSQSSSPNRSELRRAFIKKNLISIILLILGVEILFCGSGVLIYLLKANSTRVALSSTEQQTQNSEKQAEKADVADKQDDALPSDPVQLAELYYTQSIDLQEAEDYDAAISKINVAVELQPDNKVYKTQQRTLKRLKSLEEANKQGSTNKSKDKTPVSDPVKQDEPVKQDKPVKQDEPVKKNDDSDIQDPFDTILSVDDLPTGEDKHPDKSSTKSDDADRLKAEAEAERLKAEAEQQRRKAEAEEQQRRKAEEDRLKAEAEVERLKAEAEEQRRKTEAAERLKAEAERKYLEELNAKRQAETLYNEAIRLQEEGNFSLAAEKINEAIQLDPKNDRYREEKGEIDKQVRVEDDYKESIDLEKRGLYPAALVKIEDALKLDPNNEDLINQKLDIQTAYYQQYVQHRIRQEYPQALDKINKAVDFVPTEDFYKQEKQNTEKIVDSINEGKTIPDVDPDYYDPLEEYEDEFETPRGLEPGKKAGEQKTLNVDGLKIALRWCPPGTFMMGSPTSEEGRKKDEKQHEVELTQGFWIMETQITVEMFKAFVRDAGYTSKGLRPWGLTDNKWNQNSDYSWRNPGFTQSDNCPVTCISWRDAMAFSKWLGGKIDATVKLPTEAQWEYACRAGSKTAYSWGNSLNGDKANCNGNYPYGTSVKGPYLEKAVPVRNYNSNQWGIYDMHGNVWEWCLDGYADYPTGKVTDPLEPGNGSNRVFRGGSWSFYAKRCRSAYRASFVSEIRLPNLGGRCVVMPSVDEPDEPVEPDEPDEDYDVVEVDDNAGKRITKTINGVEFAFRWCPPGSFMMGSPETEEGRYDNEIQHRVILTRGFWIMETEVTQKQWKAVMEYNPSHFKGYNLFPVENVSWDDCQKFCKACTDLGLPVKLPTEAQWEYACRAGSKTAYFWGNELNGDKANCDGNYPCGTTTKGKFLKKTVPVSGYYSSNAWGIYHMHGNVYEWCEDLFGEYSTESAVDPTGPSTGSSHVIRGGSWYHYARSCRSAPRGYSQSDTRRNYIGFRCVGLLDFDEFIDKNKVQKKGQKKTGSKLEVHAAGARRKLPVLDE